MAKLLTDNLQPNPFTTYRDSQTGQWLVVRPRVITATFVTGDLDAPPFGTPQKSEMGRDFVSRSRRDRINSQQVR